MRLPKLSRNPNHFNQIHANPPAEENRLLLSLMVVDLGDFSDSQFRASSIYNPFHAICRFLFIQFLKIPERLWFTDVFRKVWKETSSMKWVNGNTRHCVKSIRTWSFSRLHLFSPNAGKYGPGKFRIRTLFTQWQIPTSLTCDEIQHHGCLRLFSIFLGHPYKIYVHEIVQDSNSIPGMKQWRFFNNDMCNQALCKFFHIEKSEQNPS